MKKNLQKIITMSLIAGMIFTSANTVFANAVSSTQEVSAKASNSYGTWKYDNVTMHYIKTTPSKIKLLQNPKGNISKSTYYNCMNGGFFGLNNPNYPKCISSIAIENNKAIYAEKAGEAKYGHGWHNDVDGGVNCVLIYDKDLNKLSIQNNVSSGTDIKVTNTENYYAIGGIYDYKKMPSNKSKVGRTAMAYDTDNNVYLICVDNAAGMTAENFYKGIKDKVQNLSGCIYLDGSASSQMKYNNEMKVKSDRPIPVVIGVQN